MDVISDPPYTEEIVRDLDIIYLGGGVDTLTLKPEDKIEVRQYEIVVTTPDEMIVCERRNICSFRQRSRVQRTPKPKEAPPTTPPQEPTHATAAEYHIHRPSCKSRQGVSFYPEACDCDMKDIAKSRVLGRPK